jgi:hypothetical protein
MTDVLYIGDNRPDGVCIGVSSSEKVAVYGSTPVAQQSTAATATDLSTALTLVNALKTALDNFGLTA